MNLQFRYAMLGSLLIAATLACSNTPSMSMAQKKFEQIEPWAWHLKRGAVKVRKFEKVDGLMKEVDGVKQYSLSYLAELECVTPVFVLRDTTDGTFEVFADDEKTAEAKSAFEGSAKFLPGMSIKSLKPGDVEVHTGTLEFTLYEKGWK